MTYADIIARKSHTLRFDGIEPSGLPTSLFPHQRDLVSWALRKGRAAIFADTGLGKTLMELAWAQRVSHRGRVLILAPLAVASQIVAEGRTWGIECGYTRDDSEGHRIAVANYEMLHQIDPSRFVGVVLDESSILKSYSGSTRTVLIESFSATPYRLAATATPAPNDFTELGNHSEFLGVKTRVEMLAEYFAHDGGSTQDWRVKGHAVASFWRWVASWGAVVRSPADLGHDATAYALPPLRHHEIVISTDDHDARASGLLFAQDALTLQEQRAVRRATIGKRASEAARIASMPGPCIVWCELNDEADECERMIDGSVQVSGADSLGEKIGKLEQFAMGAARVLVTKPSVCGFGLNWQHCHRMVFAGASHSYEQTYQAIRRCWRFGQKMPVDVYTLRADTERAVIENYRRKEADAARLGAEMASHVMDSVRAEVIGVSAREWNPYAPSVKMTVPAWAGMESL